MAEEYREAAGALNRFRRRERPSGGRMGVRDQRADCPNAIFRPNLRLGAMARTNSITDVEGGMRPAHVGKAARELTHTKSGETATNTLKKNTNTTHHKHH